MILPMQMRLSRSTIAALLALALWFGLDFIGLRRLVDKEPLVSLAGLMLALLVAFFVAGALQFRYAAPPYVLSLLVWLALQIQTHWSSYLLPASQAKLHWYDRVFGEHIRVLPVLPARTTPDAFHTVLAVLILVNLILATFDIFRRTPSPSVASQ
ncbi:MAG TPA: hypothetical protein VMV46_14830 [Thermoanaerobaculia bacterium]|nr:hypothetical protein [Thermoanaerobaculia bacterium]